MNWNQALKGMGAYGAYKYLRGMDWPADMRDSMLDRMGLTRKDPTGTILGGLGFFALGVLVGSALGVILAPMPGPDMRSTLKQGGVKGVMDRMRPAVPSA